MGDKIEIIVGTTNPHKILELNKIAEGTNIKFKPIEADDFDPFESGSTFMENAYIKAKEASNISKKGVYFMADDSGLCVDALSGAPGIHSARYAKTPDDRINKLLTALKDEKQRSAHFTCALCLVDKKGNIIHSTEGKVNGEIGYNKKGENGFGYDPIFIVEGKNCTMAELSEENKNKLSHRGKALKSMLEWIKENL